MYKKILPVVALALLATVATMATAQEESWPGSPTTVRPGPMAPGGVVGDDDDETTIEVDADNDENDDADEADEN